MFQRAFEISANGQSSCQIVVCLRVIRIQAKRAPIFALGVSHPATLVQNDAQQFMRVEVVGIANQQPSQNRLSLTKAACLEQVRGFTQFGGDISSRLSTSGIGSLLCQLTRRLDYSGQTASLKNNRRENEKYRQTKHSCIRKFRNLLKAYYIGYDWEPL